MPSSRILIVVIAVLIPAVVSAETTGSGPFGNLSSVRIERPAPARFVPAVPPKAEKKNKSKGQAPGTEEPAGHKLSAGEVLDQTITVLPEMTTTVRMSSSDVNRIICPAEIKAAPTSDEKGIKISYFGKDAFVKFKVGKSSDGKLSYSSTPTEIFVICGGNTYSMIALPSRIPTQTIRLSTGLENRIRDNSAIYSGLSFEKKLIRAIRDVYTDNLPDSYQVTNVNDVNMSFKGIIFNLRRMVDIEGEGIRVKEFHASLKPAPKQEDQKTFTLSEKLFLKKEFSQNPVAISIENHTLRPGDVSRVFIVEQRAEKYQAAGLQLPVLDSALPMTTQQAGAKPNPPSMSLRPPSGPSTPRTNHQPPPVVP